MFERILLPLDGSELAEVAIPYGEELAGRLGAELILLHVSTSQQEPLHHMHKIYIEDMADTVRRELKKKFPRRAGLQVRAEALTGEAAEAICGYVPQHDIKLIVLATHGTSGVKTWMLGSVVDKVVRAVGIPALVIRARESRPPMSKKRLISRILLPLDASEVSRAAVPYAAELAERLKASITLFRMARRTYGYMSMEGMATMSNVDWAQIDGAAVAHVRAYLVDVEKELRGKGIPVKHMVTLGTDPAHEILEQGSQVKADLVVMAIRGRSPIARWVFGSTAEKVLREGDLPLLLVGGAQHTVK